MKKLIVFAMLLLLTDMVIAAVPLTMTSQIILRNSTSNNPLAGEFLLNYTLYNNAGLLIWNESHTTTLDDGIASDLLGSTNTLNYNLFLDSEPTINISVNGTKVFGYQVTTYPYAFISQYAMNINWSNISNKPVDLDTNNSDNVNFTTTFDGDVNGTYNNISIEDDSHLHSWSNITGAPTVFGNTTTEIFASVNNNTFYLVSNPAGYISSYENTNCSADNSCGGIVYEVELNKSYVDSQDNTQDECSEISGCVINAYNSEGNLTGILDDNYVGLGTKLGNTTIEIFTAVNNDTFYLTSNPNRYINITSNCSAIGSCPNVAYDDEINKTYVDNQDDAQDSCAEITGCVVNAYNSETNLTGLLDDNYVAIGSKLGNTSVEIFNAVNNNTFIKNLDEGNLDVNQSDYWIAYNSVIQLNYQILSDWANISNTPTVFGNTTVEIFNAINNNTFAKFTDTVWVKNNQLYNNSETLFVNRSLWSTIDNYPTACSSGYVVTGIGDSLTCSYPTAIDLNCTNCIGSTEVLTDNSGDCGAGSICGGGHTHTQYVPYSSNLTGDVYGNYSLTVINETVIQNMIFDNDNAANLNVSEKNISTVNCIIFDSGGKICSGV